MLVIIDNYDSFTYNLVQYLLMMREEVKVVRNDEKSVGEIIGLQPDQIIISPGPGRPEDAGISVSLIKACTGQLPILGVCLGHQCIGAAFGGHIVQAKQLMHGKVSAITHDGSNLFQGVRSPFNATRYHSLAIERETFPEVLEVTATSEDGEIMALQHRDHQIFGVQFHPESILTTSGKKLLANFTKLKVHINRL